MSRTRIAWAAWSIVAALAVASAALHVLNGPSGWAHEFGFLGASVIVALGMASAGLVVAVQQPRNPVGWLFIGGGASLALSSAAQQYAIHGAHVAPGSLPLPVAAAWLGSSVIVVLLPLLALFLPLLFPDGKLPSPRWRIPAWLMVAVSIALLVLGAIPPHWKRARRWEPTVP